MNADLSVIIPVYNRGDVIRYTFESLRRASAGLRVETILVDDGSEPPTSEVLARFGYFPTRVHRQKNQGLLLARLVGLELATGRHTLFLDSDDLVGTEKLRAQVAAMDAARADVSYTDTAHCILKGDYDDLWITADKPSRDVSDAAEFYILVQPPPHAPVFRTDYLRSVVARRFFPPLPLYNTVAEIWFYHNAAPRPARVLRVPGPHTIVGIHPDTRLTDHWEKLGVGSLAVMEAFARSTASCPEAARARRFVGEKAFYSWRALPHSFSREFAERELNLWRSLAPGFSSTLGGGLFRKFARLLGAERAGRLFRIWQAGPYKPIRTLADEDLSRLIAALPPPGSLKL